MLRKTLTVLGGALLAVPVPAAPALAVPVQAAAPTPPPTPTPPGFVPRTDPLPDELRAARAKPSVKAAGGTASGLVIGGDQGGHRIVVLDAAKKTWTTASAKWKWTPTASNGFADVAHAWSLPSDVRVRKAKGKTYVLSADSKGFLGAVEYPSGKRLWATDAGAPSNPHATELLPNGNVAAAASTGGWIRVYAASQGRAASAYTQFALKGGHGVLWDPRRKVLWAIGDDHLVSLKVGGTAGKPTLKEVSRSALPSQGGHDLAPVYGDRDRLWITTNYGVYQYVKSTKRYTASYRGSADIDLPIVKAVGDNPSTRQVVLTRPREGCATTWCTDTAEFFGSASQKATRTLPGAQFYKVRWFVPAYQ
ncbi:DUF6528 family protein [Actinomadura rugatobispora]|uniref:DUF6528 family protein n=1 Tax=Actinomadura rugatobispora TaxID=1994 RepID=A0ABW1AGM5_9ACTN|nr:hypothetical protein GCM10010200_071580 [Actinomadura rugatobispora]